MGLNLKTLIGRLDTTSRKALEAAVGRCVAQTHYDVSFEHWFLELLEVPGGDVPRIFEHFGLEPARAIAALQRAIERFKRGNGGRPELAPSIQDLARDAWIAASINYGRDRIRSGMLLLASLQNLVQERRWLELYPEIRQLNPHSLEQELLALVAGGIEDQECLALGSQGAMASRGIESQGAAGTSSPSTTPALDQYTIDVTEEARLGRLDPVLGRDPEIRQIIDILTRKRQNNPILTGEAGVGKTAVVEGFAQRIVAGDVPEKLRDVALRRLDLGLLQAGAGVKGEFENRLKQVIEEVQASPQPIVLFIDEAHTMIGAGGAAGQQDAANLLKPALARGELRTVAATTWAEYKKFFEKDPALSRRFQVVKVDEPDEAAAIEMMRGISKHLETHHQVDILEEAIAASVRLSARYIAGRQLPDKSTSVLDTACARVSMSQHTIPGPIEDQRRRVEALSLEIAGLEAEHALGTPHQERIAALARARDAIGPELAALERRWTQELELVERARELRLRLIEGSESKGSQEAVAETDPAELRTRFAERREELRKLQGDSPLVALEVDAQAIADVISNWTGIPVGRMVADQIQSVLSLEARLAERIIGQDHALAAIAKRIHTARAGLDHPGRPQGVFLLVGPSGVGKTETALALSEALFGGERNLITINLSEYQESHTVSGLKGSPPGYVGYGEGGVLTEAVRRRPYSVVLLDEAEKAHPDVMELFFQVFDKGMLEDGEGREIDFKNTVILLGSNIGTEKIHAQCADPELLPTAETLEEMIREDLLGVFPAALLGRLVVVPYYPLPPHVLERIVDLQLGRIADRLETQHGAQLICGDEVRAAITARCTDTGSGARAIDRILTHHVLPQISAELLACLASGRAVSRVQLGMDSTGAWSFEFEHV